MKPLNKDANFNDGESQESSDDTQSRPTLDEFELVRRNTVYQLSMNSHFSFRNEIPGAISIVSQCFPGRECLST